MSAVELRRQLAADVKKLPDAKLASLVDFARYLASKREVEADEDADLYAPESVRAIRKSRADFAAGRYITLDDLKRKTKPERQKRKTRTSVATK